MSWNPWWDEVRHETDINFECRGRWRGRSRGRSRRSQSTPLRGAPRLQVDISSLEQTRHLPTIRKTFTSSVPGRRYSSVYTIFVNGGGALFAVFLLPFYGVQSLNIFNSAPQDDFCRRPQYHFQFTYFRPETNSQTLLAFSLSLSRVYRRCLQLFAIALGRCSEIIWPICLQDAKFDSDWPDPIRLYDCGISVLIGNIFFSSHKY